MSKAMKARRSLFGFLPIIALVLGYQELFMSQVKADGGIKNVVLLHGGFDDGSGWQGVYDALKKDGYNVAIVQNPTLRWRMTSRSRNGRWPRSTVRRFSLAIRTVAS